MTVLASERLTTTALLERLVGFDTTSRNSNLALIRFVRDYLAPFGLRVRESRDGAGQHANLHVMLGPQAPGGIALSGHVDTVPVDGQSWHSDPFVLSARDGRLYARGAADMKGFVASMLAAVPDLLAMPLTRPVHLFITFDEEVSMQGARLLVRDLGDSGLRPDLCVVGEPTLMQPVLGHKGRLAVEVAVRGRAGHSADPARGVNAVHAAAEAIAWIAAEARRRAALGPFADAFRPPHTTSQVGTASGGSMLNIIPEQARFSVEWRTIPGDEAEAELARLRDHVARAIEPAMRAADPACGFSFAVRDWVPGMALPADHDLAALVRHAAGSNASGHVSYATEGGLYQEAGIPTIICGPGSIEQAHIADEWILPAQLEASDAFIRRLVARYAA